jgi:hypothetical protein
VRTLQLHRARRQGAVLPHHQRVLSAGGFSSSGRQALPQLILPLTEEEILRMGVNFATDHAKPCLRPLTDISSTGGIIGRTSAFSIELSDVLEEFYPPTARMSLTVTGSCFDRCQQTAYD